jgi:predicted metal-dependent HD superfamily phosphohydrolase
MILATKEHQRSDDETNLFTDADLSVLGADRETYLLYVQQIRAEYSIYPDILYNPGRKKVLEHFLNMENIFKTNEFRTKYESAARKNLEAEIRLLTK